MVLRAQPVASVVSNMGANAIATSNAQTTAPFICQYLSNYSHLVDMPWLSPLLFELIAVISGLTGLALQICNIYKTAWWLPYSDAEYPLMLDKIDYNAVSVAVLIILRRFFAFFCRVAVELSKKSQRSFFEKVIMVVAAVPVLVYLVLMAWFLYQLSQAYPAERFGYLLFPAVTYLILFGFQLKPLYSTGISGPNELGRSTVHVCTAVPALCRAECSELASDFNARLAHLFFNSAVTVFYAAIIPLLFTGPEPVFYDEMWAGHVILLSYLSQFSLYCAFYLPCRYVDIMQRCAAHIGRWKRLDSPIPASFWTDSQMWTSGSIVRHSGKVYRALCPFNAAIPGYSLHTKFHMLFCSPVRFFDIPLICSLITLAYSLFELIFCATEWHQALGVGLLTLANGASSFYLLRGRFILRWTNNLDQDSSENANNDINLTKNKDS